MTQVGSPNVLRCVFSASSRRVVTQVGHHVFASGLLFGRGNALQFAVDDGLDRIERQVAVIALAVDKHGRRAFHAGLVAILGIADARPS